MSGRHDQPPAGLKDHTAAWHFAKFVEFTKFKQQVGEPSPHLAIVGHMMKGRSLDERLWMLGCYAATYCLPTAQVFWTLIPVDKVRQMGPGRLEDWLTQNWKGVVTRTERRCVRSPKNMRECLWSYAEWMSNEQPSLIWFGKQKAFTKYSREDYDDTWESVEQVKFFGRYIAIRFIEGLRRYFNVPAMLYDIRSIGGWSPKRALCYLYPQHTTALLRDDKEGNILTDRLASELLDRVKVQLPAINEYVLAAMLCEYKAAFENYKQYPGWTIDQEPLLYDKALAYWKNDIDTTLLWKARKALFPPEVLGELNGWNGTRWDLTTTLRDHGYNWNDLLYVYSETEKRKSWGQPVKRHA